MRIVFGVLSLLLIVLVIGLLAKKQLAPGSTLPDIPGLPASVAPSQGAASRSLDTATPQQNQRLQQQYKQAIEEALQQVRPTGDEVK